MLQNGGLSSGVDFSKPVEYLRAKEAAELIGITHWCLRKWMREGHGPPHMRRGKLYMFLKSDVDTWIARRRSMLNVKQATVLTGVERSWLITRLKMPNPPPYEKQGTQYLFPRDEFLEWARRPVIR